MVYGLRSMTNVDMAMALAMAHGYGMSVMRHDDYDSDSMTH